MDDSGFFSSQVMDEALKSFDLQLVRWRSERCRDLQATPEIQEAFVFNLSSHWFVIRRFGHSKHFFFDLNSFHPAPKHVSPLYLGLQIDQAEHEGYSVFVVLSTAASSSSTSSSPAADELTVATLPHCSADDTVFRLAEESGLANDLSALTAGTGQQSDRRTAAMFNDETVFTSSGKGPAYSTGFGNEDEELNRAIEASLQQGQSSSSGSGTFPSSAASGSYASKAAAATAAAATAPAFGSSKDDFGGGDEDPELAAAIAASLEMSGSPHLAGDADAGSASASASSKRQRQISGGEDMHGGAVRRKDTVATKEEEMYNLSDGDAVEADDDIEEEEEDEDEENSGVHARGTGEEQEEAEPTAEELRQRRLARFGGA